MITLQNYPEIMTADEVCEILNISKNHCLKLLNEKNIKGFKVKEKSWAWKITRPALIQYLSGFRKMT